MQLSLAEFFISLANYLPEFEDEFGKKFVQEVDKALTELPSEGERERKDYEDLRNKIFKTIGSYYYRKRLLEGVRLVSDTGTSEPKPLASPLENKIKEVAEEIKKVEEQLPPTAESSDNQE